MKMVRIASIVKVLILCLAVSCTKDGDIIYKDDPDFEPTRTPLVTVIYSPDGLGDQSYNDLIYKGVEDAVASNGLRAIQLSPISFDDGVKCVKAAIDQMSTAGDSIRRLLIVTSAAYDDVLRQNSPRIDNNPYSDILYFETQTPLTSKGSTLFIQYYGAMYEAGAVAPIVAPEVLLVAANPENPAVEEAVKGFQDGFDADYFDTKYEKKLVLRYIAEGIGDGYKIDDTTALEILFTPDWVGLDQLLVPVCGGAGGSFNRLCDIFGLYQYVGIDRQQVSSKCHFSVVKHVERAVFNCIDDWLYGQMQKHYSLGLSDGYTELTVHPYTDEYKDDFSQKLTDALRQQIHEEAVKKEAEYAK